MICFNCGLKLHSGSEKECRFCGVRFSARCAACSFPNPTAAKFCVNCGSRLAKDESQSSVENYATLVEGRKNVAVVFADVSGFTALSEKMDPEEVREIINECFNYITSPVYELGGTIDKYIGDCVMVLFGARYTHTDDARRAVLCALKMMDLIHEFSVNNLSSRGLSLNLSIGINYGLVVTGGVGNYFDRDYTVMGDIVNTAQRLQTSAMEGTILVSESVYAETSGWFDYSGADEVKVRNRETPVRCYQPLKINVEYRYGGELTFIGRQKETAFLNTLLNKSMNTGLQTIVVSGEAGIGKTRLLKEFTSRLGGDIKKVWTDCGSDFANRPYSLITGILNNIMNINPFDSINMKQHRLISFLDYILDNYSDEEIKRSYNFLGLLMGLDREPDFGSILQSMNFDNVHREIIRQLTLFFRSLCSKQKLVIVIDDLQWSDSNSIKMLSELFSHVHDIKAVVLCATRLEKVHLPVENRKVLKLGSFAQEEAASLTCGLLECEQLDAQLLEMILRLTNGNPLYIRELVSSLKRMGGFHVNGGVAEVEKENLESMPSSIRNLINSNLSVLDSSVYTVLQAASVVGKEFSMGIVRHLLDDPGSDEELVEIPLQMGIFQLKTVHTSARAVDKVYAFTHEIEREVIYEGILNKSKKVLHKKIAEYIEAKYGKEPENHYETLAGHYYLAGMEKKASGYFYLSALKQKNTYNFDSATEYFNRYLESCKDEQTPEETERLAKTYRELAYIRFVKADYDFALKYLDEALKYSVLQDDIFAIKLLEAEIYKDKGLLDRAGEIVSELEPKIREDNSTYGQWLQLKCNILRIQGDPAAFQFVKRSEKILKKAMDFRSLSEIMKHAGIIHFSRGDIKDALDFMKKSYRYAEKNRNLDLMANVSGDLGIIYYSIGRLPEAQEFLNKSMEISKSISFQKGITAACINLGILYLDKGLFSKARTLFEESRGISVEVGSRLYECISLINLGDIAYEEGNFEEAEADYRKSLEMARTVNTPVEEGINLLGIVKVMLKQGRLEEVPELLQHSLTLFNEADEIVYTADCHLCAGILEAMNGNDPAAIEHFDEAERIAEECRNDRRKLKAVRHKGEILVRLGRCNEAAELLERAVKQSGTIESDFDSAKCLYRLSEAQAACGLVREADESLIKAAESISKVDPCRWVSLIGSRLKK